MKKLYYIMIGPQGTAQSIYEGKPSWIKSAWEGPYSSLQAAKREATRINREIGRVKIAEASPSRLDPKHRGLIGNPRRKIGAPGPYRYRGNPKYEAKSSGPKWKYQDSRGIEHIGYMEKFFDKGGTDITYFMRDQETGELSVLSGSLVKRMARQNPRMGRSRKFGPVGSFPLKKWKVSFKGESKTVSAKTAYQAAELSGVKIQTVLPGKFRGQYLGYFSGDQPPVEVQLLDMPAAGMENPPRTKIYNRIVKVYASKAGMPHKCDAECKRHKHLYVHEFKKKASIYGLKNGSLIVE